MSHRSRSWRRAGSRGAPSSDATSTDEGSAMISRRFLIRTMAALPAVAMLTPMPGAAAGIGERPGDLAEGDPDAPVTLIEYFSLTCPHCRWFHENIYHRLKPAYVDTGKLRYVARDFPLNPPAVQATILARCAGRGALLHLHRRPVRDLRRLGRCARFHRRAGPDRRVRRGEPGAVRGVSRGQGPGRGDIPGDDGGPGRVRRVRYAHHHRQWREIRGQDALRGARRASRPSALGGPRRSKRPCM